MTKIDFKATLPSYRAKAGVFEVIEMPPLSYLMIDGHGDPNAGGPFAAAVSALFSTGYKLKFASKLELGRDYTVMPLEGLWSAADNANFTTELDKASWDWTLLMMVPDWITPDLLAAAQAAAEAKGGAAVSQVRLETLNEGRCVQTLHLGPFDDEGPVLHRLHQEFVPNNGLQLRDRHHEIYLSDFTKTAPAKLRTVLRHPVSAAT